MGFSVGGWGDNDLPRELQVSDACILFAHETGMLLLRQLLRCLAEKKKLCLNSIFAVPWMRPRPPSHAVFQVGRHWSNGRLSRRDACHPPTHPATLGLAARHVPTPHPPDSYRMD